MKNRIRNAARIALDHAWLILAGLWILFTLHRVWNGEYHLAWYAAIIASLHGLVHVAFAEWKGALNGWKETLNTWGEQIDTWGDRSEWWNRGYRAAMEVRLGRLAHTMPPMDAV